MVFSQSVLCPTQTPYVDWIINSLGRLWATVSDHE